MRNKSSAKYYPKQKERLQKTTCQRYKKLSKKVKPKNVAIWCKKQYKKK